MFKIIWWNVEDGITDRQLGQGDLQKGINDFSERLDADIIILGEFGKDSEIISEGLMLDLKKKYIVELIPYSPYCGDFGFLILSKFPFKLKSKQRLAWEAGAKASPRARKRFEKRYGGRPLGRPTHARR